MTRSVAMPRSFEPIAVFGERLLPIDGLIAAYNAFLAFLWIGPASTVRFGWLVVALHLAAAMLPVWLSRLPDDLPGPARVARQLYPLVMLPAFWAEIDALFPLRHADTFDAYVFGLEQALFGMQLAETWMPSAPQMWWSELMHFSYFGYYAAIYLPPLYMAFAGRRRATEDMVFRLMAAYLTCYVIFLLFPVDGPHFRLDHYEGDLTGGFFYGLVAVTQAAGDSRGCAFPSSHVVGAVTAAYLGWRWLPRWIAWLLAIEALGVVLSTVYTQNHYAVDAVAGTAVALALNLLILPPFRSRPSAGGPPGDSADSEPERLVPVLWTRREKGRRSWAT